MADPLVLEIMRADDLLALRFEFTNLTIAAAPGELPQLVRQQIGQPTLISIDIGPQHISEWQGDDGQPPDDLAPAPVPSVMADHSRLVFAVPDAISSIPLTLGHLLDWARFRLVVPRNALPDPTGPLGPIPPTVSLPGSGETALELPFGLLLSPDSSGGWTHAVNPVTHDGRTELWHTRLGVLSGGKVDELRLPAIRAVCPVHGNIDLTAPFTSHPLQTIPKPNDRELIAHLPVPERSGQSSPFGDRTSDFTAPPIGPLSATHLFLSRLGAWTNLSGSWSDSPTVTGWKQIVCMGRDRMPAWT